MTSFEDKRLGLEAEAVCAVAYASEIALDAAEAEERGLMASADAAWTKACS